MPAQPAEAKNEEEKAEGDKVEGDMADPSRSGSNILMKSDEILLNKLNNTYKIR